MQAHRCRETCSWPWGRIAQIAVVVSTMALSFGLQTERPTDVSFVEESPGALQPLEGDHNATGCGLIDFDHRRFTWDEIELKKAGWIVAPEAAVRFNYFVSIRDNSFNHECSGIVIKGAWVLTAAHCIEAVGPNPLVMFLSPEGTIATSWHPGAQAMRVEDAEIHPKWTGNVEDGWDAAMLRLPQRVNITGPALAAPKSHVYCSMRVFVLGLYDEGGLYDRGGHLQMAEMTIVEDHLCPGLNGLAPDMLCAFSYSTQLEEGHAGGPGLILHTPNGPNNLGYVDKGTPGLDLLVGIMSHGNESHDYNRGTGMARTKDIWPWIFSIVHPESTHEPPKEVEPVPAIESAQETEETKGFAEVPAILMAMIAAFTLWWLRRPSVNELKYNQAMMRFLEEQLKKAKKVRNLADQPGDRLERYDSAIEKGERLLAKHQRFELAKFYKINDARHAVEGICVELLDYLEDRGLQDHVHLQQKIPEDVVNADKHHLYMLLAYVLEGKQLSLELERDWQAVKDDHESTLKGLQIICDDDIQREEKIGAGSGGNVYKSKWQGVPVAVKDVVPANNEVCLEKFASFFREASTQASLTFKHVTQLYGITKSGKMVMQLACCDLTTFRHRVALTWPVKRRALYQAALGLRHLHMQDPQLIHRDVKSSNFLVFGEDLETCTVKISDFGLTIEDTKTRSKTARGDGGSWLYIAPEFYDKKPLSLASDVFSLGVVMYEVVTGKRPYASAGGREMAVMAAKCSGEEPAEVQDGQCPQEMLELMRSCIACTAGERPSIGEVCEEFEKWMSDLEDSCASAQ
ncbi:unnamed protein product [Ostreobium quekettii]|uniref:Uncharacterized protein n=1 Tax=Ostreobium quekettii TaxID=121088 RepID=A0A8S1J2Y4_9CHLO|nr:unnamed protein product [Ostreobium quekettii]